MNQILSIENPNKQRKSKVKNHAPIEIKTIIRFFSISILIFGIFMIGSGSYSMYQNSKLGKVQTKPTIHVNETSATEITLEITSETNLSKVTYNWNRGEETEIQCNGQKKVEQKIEIPTGDNTLYVYATDVNEQEITYQKQYSIQGDIEIDIEKQDPNIKITANGKDTLSYMTYRWDEEEETRIDINDVQTEQIIEVPSGQHTLTVVVVDINNKTQTKEQQVVGAKKPQVEVTTDGSDNFIIKASDEQGIKKVEFIINETEKNRLNLDQALPLEQRKEFEYSYPLHEGENKLEVRVYNESDVSEVVKVRVQK